ncbi:unnamed protein product [Polarella glacialis]|uniref:Uncharacterized protein n=1 Tax=Polarella glacialis TaxID=89957 RepID=A0A813LZK2_POLGL|nr:unnamed protein product [Polarella glacialis]
MSTCTQSTSGGGARCGDIGIFLAPAAASFWRHTVGAVCARTTLARYSVARAAEGDGAAGVISYKELARISQQLAPLLKADPVVGYQWRRFQHQKGLQPSTRADEATVQEFLALHSAGALDPIEVASAEVLADFDKVQKEHPAATWLWSSVGARGAFGIVNPKGIPAKIVQDFLESYRAGSFEQPEMASDELAAEVNSFRWAGGKAKWQAFANSQFGPKAAPSDPKFWPADLLRRFLAEQPA